MTILGDTRQTPAIFDLAKNADVLVHECTFGRGDARLARNYYHSTCIQAANVALIMFRHVMSDQVFISWKKMQGAFFKTVALLRILMFTIFRLRRGYNNGRL